MSDGGEFKKVEPIFIRTEREVDPRCESEKRCGRGLADGIRTVQDEADNKDADASLL